MLSRLRPLRQRQHGLSLVELMVGIAVGMFVVAAAATLVATQLTDNRRLLLEVQVQQDLRATADIISRDLRRIGVVGPDIVNSVGPVWDPAGITPPRADTLYNDVRFPTAGEIRFNSSRVAGQTGPFGYKLANGVIQSLIPGPSVWTDLTDGDAVTVTDFVVAWHEPQDDEVRLACPQLCSDGTKSCWPTIKVRALDITIKGHAKNDPSVVREIHSLVRLRNDMIDFKVDPLSATSPACPS